MKCSKLSVLLVLCTLFISILGTKNIYAGTIPTMTEQQAKQLINYLKSGDNYKFYNDAAGTTPTETTIYNMLNNAEAQTLANHWNNNIANLINSTNLKNYDITFENIVFLGMFNKYRQAYDIIVIFQNYNNSNYMKITYNGTKYLYDKYNGTPYYSFLSIYNNNYITNLTYIDTLTSDFSVNKLNNNMYITPYYYNNNSQVSIPFLYTLNENTEFYINYSGTYKVKSYNYYTENISIENNSTSEYGYLWSPASNGGIRVNRKNTNNVNIDCDFYVGDELNYNYEFYYYSGDTKIDITNLISNTTNNNIEETGTWFKFYIAKENLWNLKDNTRYYLTADVSLNENTENIVDNFYAFYTTTQTIETGQTGNITNNSGENTGKMDLTGIESGIENINNNITNSTEQIKEQLSGDTTKIVESIQKQNENYWGNSGELSGDEQEQEIENALNGIIDNMSGEIAQTEIIGALEGAEDKFKNILEYGKQHPEALDLAFSWEDIKYENQVLIPASTINFSQICRDIPILGTVKNYLNIIATFGASIALIKHIWNLLLATLGIDNPYLYEDENGDVYTTETLDEMTGQRTYTITQTNGRGSSINRKYTKYPEVKHRQIGFRR